MRPHLAVPFALALGLAVAAPTPAQTQAPAPKPAGRIKAVPGPGVAVPDADRQALEAGLQAIDAAVVPLKAKKDAKVDALLPDVLVFTKAVRSALDHDEFFNVKDIAKAKQELVEGKKRADQLLAGESPWTSQTGLVVRGYVSKIDGSIQPYGLVVPPTYTTVSPHRYRLDVWFHGRGEQLSEVNFLDERARQMGEFTPPDTIVLHPYGRYCNAFKFAGEVDVLEALNDVKQRYKVDEDRISVRGFSMGGAAAWHMGVHHADRWFACNPGAGFAETARFVHADRDPVPATWYEQSLYHLYDATDYAANLLQCPTVAYSGAKDPQKQAADVMDEALLAEDVRLLHILGPDTAHKYHPEAAREVDRRLASIAVNGRKRIYHSIDFVTYTLKYDRMNWVTINALGEHWSKSAVRAALVGESDVRIGTRNVTALTLDMPPGFCPLDPAETPRITIDSTEILAPRPRSDRSWHVELVKNGDTWERRANASGLTAVYIPLEPLPAAFQTGATNDDPKVLRKRHNLQGPIDDAFMDAFVFVRPTGTSPHKPAAAWVTSELDRATKRWRTQFRGDAKVVDDTALTDEQIAASNLILWGDPASNAVIRRIVDKLPIRWDGGNVVVGDRKFPADTHAPILIFPNPLNPTRYVVLNSGFTFREAADLNNARQIPVLPDWAVIDVTTPPDGHFPGKVADADFFGEAWELKPPHQDPGTAPGTRLP